MTRTAARCYQVGIKLVSWIDCQNIIAAPPWQQDLDESGASAMAKVTQTINVVTSSGRRSTRAVRIIECEGDVKAGVRALRRKCRIMRGVHDIAGDPPLRRPVGGFTGLARIVVGQQVSIASAAAIWQRTHALITPFEAKRFKRLGDKRLQGAGLSRAKINTLRAVAAAIVAKELDLAALETMDDAGVHEALTAVKGIGPWTADVYLMFCIGRADSWAPGDLALQIALQHAMQLDERPGIDEMVELAQQWRPWRGVAARLLWSYYAAVRQPKSGAPV